MLGIPDYDPNFFDNSDSFLKVFKKDISKLIGLTLDDYWLMWHLADNTWYNDGPLILSINNNHYEFTAYELDKFSLTVNQIDIEKKLDWYGAGDEIPLTWKNKGNEEVNRLIGRKIEDINIITFNFISTTISDQNSPENVGQRHETGFMLHGIEFQFEKAGLHDKNNFLQIFNALDANGITTDQLSDNNQFKKINVLTY